MSHPSTERPLSPHLTIYKPQITSMLSIMHRITGTVNAIGLIVLIGWLWSAAFDAKYYACLQEIFASQLGKIALIGWTLTFFYHLSNGIRHLWWDMGKGFQLKHVTLSGIFVVGLAIGLTAVTWYHIIQTTGW